MLTKMIIDSDGVLLDEVRLDFIKGSDGDNFFNLRNINMGFENINLLVGESRSYKSTMLNMIYQYRDKISQNVYWFSQKTPILTQLNRLINNVDYNTPPCVEPYIAEFEDFLKENLDVKSVSLNPIEYDVSLSVSEDETIPMPRAEENEIIKYSVEVNHEYYTFKSGMAMTHDRKGIFVSTENEPLPNASSGTEKIGLLYTLLKYNLIKADDSSIILIDEIEPSLSPMSLPRLSDACSPAIP